MPVAPFQGLTLGLVEAMFEYLDRLESELVVAGSAKDPKRRSALGLPRYRFQNPRIARGTFPSSSAPVQFVFVSTDRREAAAPATDTGWRPANTVNDPETCKTRGLCYPHLVRQEVTLGDIDVVVTRNRLPYGINHGIVRSAAHDSQKECFRPERLKVALRLAQLLGSDHGLSLYEVWIAGEGFNTQWHFHVQFRKQRGPVWSYFHGLGPLSTTGRQILSGYPSHPVYFEHDHEGELLDVLSRELLATQQSGSWSALGVLLSYEHGRWKVLFVKSNPTEPVFGKQLGLHEHLGEVVLENEQVFDEVQEDIPAATLHLEKVLSAWCDLPCRSPPGSAYHP